jgi:hypothetical protein
MLYTQGPKSVTYVRSNSTNGFMFDLQFTIRATNYILVNDILRLKLPRPLHFNDNTTCSGADGKWAAGPLKCTISADKLTVDIMMSINGRYHDRRNLQEIDSVQQRGRRLYYSQIPAEAKIIITLTNIANDISRRPTPLTFYYALMTAESSLLEVETLDLQFQNDFVTLMDPAKAGVTPNYWEKGRLANYTF